MDADTPHIQRAKDVDKSQWIMIADKNLEREGDSTFCKLRHPKSNEAAMFLLSHRNNQIYELLKFSEPFRSWFIGESVQQDGSFMITTPVDPVFLVLPYLFKTHQTEKYQLLEQLLCDEEYHEAGRLASCVDAKQLQHIADVKGDDDYRAYRYNKEKTVTWLKKKVERVVEQLKEENIRVSGSATASYVSVTQQPHDDYVRYAHGMVCDYLPPELSEELRTSMGIPVPAKEKRPLSNSDEPQAKRAKSEDTKPLEDYSVHDNKDGKTKSGTKSKLDKVDKSGMKSISSFFAPKAKK